MRKACIVPIFVITWMFSVAAFAEVKTTTRPAPRMAGAERLSSFRLAERLKKLKFRPGSKAQAIAGYSYVTFIPFVTRANGTRTNLGLNNYSQVSFVKGANPSANVQVLLVDQQGLVAGQGEYVVQSNQMRQIDNVISALGGDVDTGWLFILSDEPLTAWASVIFNATDDPSIELATRFSGRRLMIQSSVKSATFQSSLVIVNLGFGGNVSIKIYDNQGSQISSKTVFIQDFGLYLDDDVRSAASGTYGQIVIETEDDSEDSPFLLANSIVKSAKGTGAFFPAFPLPPASLKSIAGVWEGSVIGTLINAQVRLTLFQEETSLFGELEITGGDFPAAATFFSISGFISNDGTSDSYSIQVDDGVDSTVQTFSFSLDAPPITGTKMEGTFNYADEIDQTDTGTFSLSRTGEIFSP